MIWPMTNRTDIVKHRHLAAVRHTRTNGDSKRRYKEHLSMCQAELTLVHLFPPFILCKPDMKTFVARL